MSTKNHNVRKGTDVEFANGEVIEIYPLTIKSLRRFVKVLANLNVDPTKFTNEDLDAMLEGSLIILEQATKREWKEEEVEEVIDLKVFGKVMNVAMGNSSPEV